MWDRDEKSRILSVLNTIEEDLDSLAKSQAVLGKMLSGFAASLVAIEESLKQIAVNTSQPPPIGLAVAEQILIGGTLEMQTGKMLARPRAQSGPTPITDLPTGQKIAIVEVDAAGVYGALLPPGATIAFTPVSDPSVASVTPDPAPAIVNFVDANGVSRTNVQSSLSGTLAAASPIKPNVPATVGYQITNADGTPGRTGTASFQVVPGTAAIEVFVFPA
jgi:hypothetical protein